MTDTHRSLEIDRAEKLGNLLGACDAVVLSFNNPQVFDMADAILRMQVARDAYNDASKALLDDLLRITP
jgi:hypothetical protein